MDISKMEELTIEDCFTKMDELIHSMEESEVSLEDSFRYYQEGMEILKVCNSKIDTIEKEVMILSQDTEEE